MDSPQRGRFAPSPTGRMQLGNVWAAMLSRTSAKSGGGVWVLRHEDLDAQRSRTEFAKWIEDDLQWLGLTWDEGGLEEKGACGPYRQSLCAPLYGAALKHLHQQGLLYPCRCRRADLLAASAPHASDGRPVYSGKCRPADMPRQIELPPGVAVRLLVSHTQVQFEDLIFGRQQFDLAAECGDFIVRRADGAFAYQLAVVVDDARMGITEVVRGCDLIPSAAQQIYLYNLLHKPVPRFGHLPLLVNSAGQRLSKRDASLSMEVLRQRCRPEQILGYLAHLAGLLPKEEPIDACSLLEVYDAAKLPRTPAITVRTFD